MAHTSDLRQMLIEHFDLDELSMFCHDYFPQFSEFNKYHSLEVNSHRLVEYCERYGLLDMLYDAIVKARPNATTAHRRYGPPRLPAAAEDFTGRTQELNDIISHLQAGGSALVHGIRGMGGIGKTELAITAAHMQRDSYPDMQMLVALQAGDTARPASDLFGEIISAFTPAVRLPDSLDQLQSLYQQTLYDKRGLLILDNAADSEQVKPLLPPPTGWAIIVTSRKLSKLKGAKMCNLALLPEEDALTLLQRVLRDGERDEADDPAATVQLQRIVQLCGRLPLALRLAGSFLATYADWSLAEYVQALEQQRLDHLQVEGQEDITAVLQVSISQMERDDPTLVDRWYALAIFAAPFDRTAAAKVWGMGDDIPTVRKLMSNLLLRSVLEYDQESQSYTLHDLLREYALHHNPPDAERYRRYATYVRDEGEAANDRYLEGNEGVLEGVRRFDALTPHLLAVWEGVRQQDNDEARQLVCDLPLVMINLLALRLLPQQRLPLFEAGLAAARSLGDKQREGAHLGNLGYAYTDLGNVERAIGYYKQVLTITRQIKDRMGEGKALGNLGIAYRNLGDLERAIGYFEQDLAIAKEIEDRRGEGQTMGNLGNTYLNQGKVLRAISYYMKWFNIAREIGDRRGEGDALGNMGIAYKTLGEMPRAIDSYEQQLVITQEIRDRRGETLASWNLGLVYEQQGEYTRAAELMQVMVDYEQEIGHPNAEQDAAYVAEVRRKAQGE